MSIVVYNKHVTIINSLIMNQVMMKNELNNELNKNNSLN